MGAADDDFGRARALARRGSSVGSGRGTFPPPAAAATTTRIAVRCPLAGHRQGTYTVHARAPVRVLGPRFGARARWAPGGGLPATSAAGTVAGAAQDRTALLCARAALGLGRLLGPGPDPGHPVLVLGPSVALALVLAHGPARAPHPTLRIPGGALGPDPSAGAVGATVGMILGTADLVRLMPPKTRDGQRNTTTRPRILLRVKKCFSDMMSSLLADYILSLLWSSTVCLNKGH